MRVLGLQPLALPLSTLHSTGNLPCSLLVRPDDLALLSPAAGAASFAVSIPDNLVFVGSQFQCQVLQMEFGPGLQPTALGGSNALALVVGSF